MSIQIFSYRRGTGLSLLIKKLIERDTGSMRVIVPSRRDREWWLERSGHEQSGPFDSAPPETLWTWQDLYDDLCASCAAQRRRPLSPPDHLLILKRILNGVLNEDPELVRLWPGLARSGFLDVLSDDIRELLNEAVRPEQTDMGPLNSNSGSDADAEAEAEAAGPTSRLLPKIYRLYLDYLEKNHLLDSAQIWTAALDLLESAEQWGRDYSMVFAGFLSFTHGQLELVRALEARCKEIIILKPEAGLRKFYDAAEQFNIKALPAVPRNTQNIQNISENSDETQGVLVELPVAEPGLEPEAVARSLALWSSGRGELAREMPFPGFPSIGIMTQANGRDAMAGALERYHVPFTLEAGMEISQTLPGRVLSSVRNLRSRNFPTYGTALLLTQPCFAGPAFPVAGAFRAGPAGLENWEKYLLSREQEKGSETEPALLAIQSVRDFCGVISQGAEPAEIMGAFHSFLTVRGLWLDRMKNMNYHDLDESVRLTASAIETVQEKALALRELLPDLGSVKDEKLKGDDAFDFLDTWCRQSNTRPPLPLRGAVHVYTGTPPVLASYPVWVMLNVTQRTWPGPASSSPLLGRAERERLEQNGAVLPSQQDKAAQREALFRRMIQTGEKLTLISRSNTDEDDRPAAKSPFISSFLEDMKGWTLRPLPDVPIEILTEGENYEEKYIFPEIDPDASKKPGEADRRFPPVIRGAEKISGLGVSDLRELLNCPMRWWLRRQTALYERGLELTTPVDWGNLAHKLWENVWRRFKERIFDNIDSQKNIKNRPGFSELVEDEWKKFTGRDESYSAFKRLAEDFRLRRRLESAHFRVRRLGALQELIITRLLDENGGAGLRYRDVWLEEDARLRFTTGGVTFTGQCDRVEIFETGDGEPLVFITDYKEGRSEKYEDGLNIGHCRWNTDGRAKFSFGLQLSAYALMFAEQHPGMPLGGVGFLGLEDGKLSGSVSPELHPFFKDLTPHPQKLRTSIQAREEEADYAMSCAAAVLNSGEFRPDYESKSCKGRVKCGMMPVCRRGEFKGEALSDGGRSGGAAEEDTAED